MKFEVQTKAFDASWAVLEKALPTDGRFESMVRACVRTGVYIHKSNKSNHTRRVYDKSSVLCCYIG